MLVEARSGRVQMHRRVSCIIRLEVFSLAFRAISDLVQSPHERHQILHSSGSNVCGDILLYPNHRLIIRNLSNIGLASSRVC